MAGYSGTPLPKKLGIKEGASVAFVRAPPEFATALGPLPDGVRVRARAVAPLDVVVAFFTRQAQVERRLAALSEAVFPDGGLWIAWPKRSSGVRTDVGEGAIRALALAGELVDNKVCAIDETWSALRLVYRLEHRARGGPSR